MKIVSLATRDLYRGMAETSNIWPSPTSIRLNDCGMTVQRMSFYVGCFATNKTGG